MTDLSEETATDLANELENGHGWLTFEDEASMLSSISTEDLLSELDIRGADIYNIDGAIAYLEGEGFHVNNDNDYKEFIKDLYYDILVLTPQQFTDGLNKIFIREIEKWI